VAAELSQKIGEFEMDESVVNRVPVLRFLPEWFPGAYFKRFGRDVKEILQRVQDIPLKQVERNISTGISTPCVAAGLLEGCDSPAKYRIIKQTAASAYAAGIETTSSAITTFFLAMASYPGVQEKAQRELDAVVGGSRLPDFNDRVSLPYVEALYRETLRWMPVVPLGIPHAAMERDAYKGFVIERGTTVIPNIWAMAHDEIKYPQPALFNPDRYFGTNGQLDDDSNPAFGFGRRVCPGRHFASASVWLAVVSVLATFNISKKKAEDGTDVPLVAEDSFKGFVRHLLPFDCVILPRSDSARQNILEGMTTKM